MPRGKIIRSKRGDGEGTIYQKKVGKYTYFTYQITLPDGSKSKQYTRKTQAEAIKGL